MTQQSQKCSGSLLQHIDRPQQQNITIAVHGSESVKNVKFGTPVIAIQSRCVRLLEAMSGIWGSKIPIITMRGVYDTSGLPQEPLDGYF
eukprot:2493414-Pleurochrysis_carterae.AAC.1